SGRPGSNDLAVPDTWDPARYARFAAERRQPFDDLLTLLQPCPGGRVVDLGCGGGELTVELHAALGAAETVGVDASPAMLASAAGRAGHGVQFRAGDLATWAAGPVDVIAANASLHWVDGHPALLRRLAGQLAPGGQLAFQVPANFDHPSHRIAHELADSPRWAGRFDGGPPPTRAGWVLPPERYAEVLDGLGLVDLHVRLQVYGHHLDGAEAVVEWVQGTLLTPFAARLRPDDYTAFVDEYRSRLLQALGARRPYFYAFKRILARARRSG
ncbi:MAG TPA: methyltransferase domain-containing protein, partial [Acidimicrobiales bacterium]|nr:methyltransferase domain-containing protein [Acidimicrobiales bacterium]